MNLRIWYRRESTLYWLAACTSLVLSIWIASQQSIINPDAICYLLSAESIAHRGIKEAMNLCGQAKWPFYSVIIYSVVKATHLSYPTAAYLANSFFSLISVIMFILIVKELGGNLRTMWFAALTILLSHEFNGVREYIVRDHGFWAFYLSSLWLLLCFFRKPDWPKALLWNISIFIAALFRIEGAIFLFLLPFLSFFYIHYTWSQRFKLFYRLNTVTILVVVFIGSVLLTHLNAATYFGRLQDLLNQIQNGFFLVTQQYQLTKLKLASQVLSHDSMMNAGEVFFIMMLGWYFLSVVNNLSWIYSLLVFYAWRRRLVYFPFSSRWVLAAYLLINMIITAGFLFEHLFLSKRYLIGLSLVLMLWVPFALNYIYERSHKIRYQISFTLCLLLMSVTALGGIFDFGYSKDYIREAGVWIAQHIPEKAVLYANDYQLMYYSQHFNEDIFTKLPLYVQGNAIKEEKWDQYEYIALRLNKKDPNRYLNIVQGKQWQLIATFQNKRGDKVNIYKGQRP